MSQKNIHVLLVKPSQNTWFPIGYMYLVAAWRLLNIKIDFIDLDIDNLEHIIQHMQNNTYTAVCAGGMVSSYASIKDIFSTVKTSSKTTPCIVGGPLATNISLEHIFDHLGADFAVLGEAEESSGALLLHLASNTSALPKIAGVVHKNIRTKQIDNGFIPPIKPNIHTLPYPAYDFFSTPKEEDAEIPMQLTPIATGRGCIGSCAFCKPPHGQYRKRNALAVINEIEHHLKTQHIDNIYFYDEMFFADAADIHEFCKLYKKKGFNMPWQCNMRVDGPLDALDIMADSSCTHISFGFESVCDRVLKAMNKRTTHAMQLAAIDASKRAGLFWRPLWMVGNYSETKNEMQKSYDFFRTNLPIAPAVLITYPDTLNYKRAQKEGIFDSINPHDEISYITKLSDCFIGSLFPRITKFMHAKLPYLNISAMPTQELFDIMNSENSKITQAMLGLNPQISQNNTVSCICPTCKNRIALMSPKGQPFNIHATRCPYCHPLWLHVSPMSLKPFQEKICNSDIQKLLSKKRIAIIDDNETTAAFFLMKNLLQINWNTIACFIKTDGYKGEHVFHIPVCNVESLPFDVDCILTVAKTQKTRHIIERMQKSIPSDVLVLDFSCEV